VIWITFGSYGGGGGGGGGGGDVHCGLTQQREKKRGGKGEGTNQGGPALRVEAVRSSLGENKTKKNTPRVSYSLSGKKEST